MKNKIISLLLVFCLLATYFGPFIPEVKAESNVYQVSVLKSKESPELLGTFTSYLEAKYKMEAHESTEQEVAVIYKNGRIVNANYAIAKFKPIDETVAIYSTSSARFKYTYTHPLYGADAAFLDYDDNTGRAKIRISGYTGWVDSNKIQVMPISELYANKVQVLATTAIRVRKEPSLSADSLGTVRNGDVYRYYEKKESEGYTWYRIQYAGVDAWFASASGWTKEVSGSTLQTFYSPYDKSNNIIHYFAYYSGGTEQQIYTNLGPSPSYLSSVYRYYSFDGNYFYYKLTDMLDDYKEGTFNRALNKDTPFFAYYMYLSNHSKTAYEGEDLDNILENGYSTKYYRGPEEGVTYVDENGNWVSGIDRSGMSALYKQGSTFIEVQNQYGVNALLMYSAAINESARGTSRLSFMKKNIFGHGANDSCPITCAFVYDTIKDSIIYHALLTGGGYNDPSSGLYFGGHYGNKASGMNVNYASDPYWGEKMAANYLDFDSKGGKQDYLANTTGIKLTEEAVNVYNEPNTNSKVLYTLKNKSTNVANMPLTVLDKVNVNGVEFYRVYTDLGIDENGNKTPNTYNPETSQGYILASKFYVENTQPTITAEDKVVEVGSTPNYLEGVSAWDKENGDLTKHIEVIENKVNLSESGEYTLTYRVEDYSRFRKEKTIKVTVKGSNSPKIEASDITISQYTKFDAKKDVKATDYDGTDLTNLLRVEGSVNTSIKGEYEITYKVVNSLGKEATKTIKVTVIENEAPTIEASDKTVAINSSFDPLNGVSAKDKEDGDLTNKIVVKENHVDVTTPGTYEVLYEVTDSASNKVEKKITVTVSDRTSKNGQFYFDSLKVIDGKLTIKGFQTIEGIQNDLNAKIQYKVLFTNEETNAVYEQEIKRVTEESKMPFEIESENGISYKYAWFEGTLSIDNLPNGNYSLRIMAYSPQYFSMNPISNVFAFPMEGTYKESKKSVYIRNNYESREAPIQFFVRDTLLCNKTSPSNYNIENEYFKISYENEKLKIRGASHIIGGDYASNIDVKRNLVLEEIHTFKRYTYNVGSITNGDYEIELRVPDGKDKTRAWYEANLELQDLPKGIYAIYLVTSSNLSDFGELRDIFSNPIKTTWTQNDKKYSMRVVKEKRYRIELFIE